MVYCMAILNELIMPCKMMSKVAVYMGYRKTHQKEIMKCLRDLFSPYELSVVVLADKDL